MAAAAGGLRSRARAHPKILAGLLDATVDGLRRLPEVAAERRTPEEAEREVVANQLGTLIQRVADSSVREIDGLIGELETLRENLYSEGARVQQEISEYALLSQSAMQSTRSSTQASKRARPSRECLISELSFWSTESAPVGLIVPLSYWNTPKASRWAKEKCSRSPDD